MSIICPTCKEEFPDELGIRWGDSCPSCGSTLVKPEDNGLSSNTTVTEGAAVSGGIHNTDSHSIDSHDVHTADSHNVQTIDSHNSVDSHNVHNETHISHTTYQERQKTAEEVLQDKRKEFREFCAMMISEDGRYSTVALRQIAGKQSDLGVNDTDATKIKEEVQKLKRAQNVSSLSTMDRIELDAAINAIRDNRSSVKEKLRKLEGMIDHTTEETAHFHYYLLLAALYPDKCISRFERRIENNIEDNYWLTFWASFCYERAKKAKEFNAAKAMLMSWPDMPEENEFLLSADEKAASYFAETADIDDLDMAKSLLKLAKGKCSFLLEDFRRALAAVLDESRDLENDCDFYYDRFFASYVFINPEDYSADTTVIEPVVSEPAAPSPVISEPPKKGSGKIIAIASAVVTIVAIALIALLGKGNDKPTQPSIPAQVTIPSNKEQKVLNEASDKASETVTEVNNQSSSITS